jgi:hypothetical protein
MTRSPEPDVPNTDPLPAPQPTPDPSPLQPPIPLPKEERTWDPDHPGERSDAPER